MSFVEKSNTGKIYNRLHSIQLRRTAVGSTEKGVGNGMEPGAMATEEVYGSPSDQGTQGKIEHCNQRLNRRKLLKTGLALKPWFGK